MIGGKAPPIRQLAKDLGRPTLAMLAWDALIVVAFKVLHWHWVGSSSVPLSLFGSAVGIIVAFRNNLSYARWWEARTLWGHIVNNSRSLGRQVCAAIIPPEGSSAAEAAQAVEARRKIVHLQIAFVHSLRQQLRGLDPIAEIRGILTEEECSGLAKEKNVALALQLRMAILLRDARLRGWINNFEWEEMDKSLDDLMDAQGGAERIKNTPMPVQIVILPMIFVQVYCILLPIGMVESLGWLTPLGSTAVGLLFAALEKIGRDLEFPFNNKIFDVPLTAITRTIDINLRQLLEETELPLPESPIHGVLW